VHCCDPELEDIPDTTDIIAGELKEMIADSDPVLLKDETTTGIEIPTEETVLTAKAESEVHLEFIEIERPTVAAGDIEEVPRTRPYTTVIEEPVNGKETTDTELTRGVSVEKANERRPAEAAET